MAPSKLTYFEKEVISHSNIFNDFRPFIIHLTRWLIQPNCIQICYAFCWDTPSENTGLRHLSWVFSAFNVLSFCRFFDTSSDQLNDLYLGLFYIHVTLYWRCGLSVSASILTGFFITFETSQKKNWRKENIPNIKKDRLVYGHCWFFITNSS